MKRRGDRDAVLIATAGADLYGSDRMVLETVDALVSDGKRVVVTTPNDGPLVPLLEAAGAEVVTCPTPIIRKGLLNPRGLVELAVTSARAVVPGVRMIRHSNAGTVLVNTITPPLWLPLSRICGRYTVCHVHEAEASASAAMQRALYLPLTLCSAVIANSEYTRSVISRAAPWVQRRISVVVNTVGGPNHPAEPRQTLTGPIRLLYVGRLSRRKGPHVAIEALSRLRDREVEATLSIVGAVFPGNEQYAEGLQKQIDGLGLGEAVELRGFKSRVWDELAAADIVLVPSTEEESFGNTAVEAALAARPAIVSRIGGLPEAVSRSRSATLVPPADAVALADAVSRVAAHWSEFAANAQTDAPSVADFFSRSNYARRIRQVLTP